MAQHLIVPGSSFLPSTDIDGQRTLFATGLINDSPTAADPSGDEPVLLIRHYEAGDVDVLTPGSRHTTWKALYEAAYDIHQCYMGWETGDTLAIDVHLPLGGPTRVEFARIESFHVIAIASPTLPDKQAFDRPIPPLTTNEAR